MGSEQRLGITLKSSLDKRGFEETRDEAAKTEKSVSASAQKMSAEYESAMSKIKIAAFAAFAAIGAGLGLAGREAAQGEESMNRVRMSVERTGLQWAPFREQVDKTTTSLQAMTGFADDELQSALARMVDISGNAELSLSKLELVTGFAYSRNIDLATAADMVAKAMSGESGRLWMLLPGLDDQLRALGENATASERAAVMLDRLSVYEGKAAGASQTTAGQYRIATATVKDAAEAIGNAFLPVANVFLGKIIQIALGVKAWADENQELIARIGEWVPRIAGVISAVYLLNTAIKAVRASMVIAQVVAQALAGPAGWAMLVGGLAAAGAGLITANALIDKFDKALGTTTTATEATTPKLESLKTNFTGVAEAVKKAEINATAFRDLMSAGLGVEQAMRMAAGIVLPVQVVETQPLEVFGPEYDPMALAQARVDEEKKASDKIKELFASESQAYDERNAAMIAAYRVGVESLIDTDMTGKERREAIWNAFKMTAIRQVADVTLSYVKGEAMKRAAAIITATTGAAASNTAAATEKANILTLIVGWLKVAMAKLSAFYAFSGPFAPALALGTMAAIMAAMASVGSKVAGFQQGGIVPGFGIGDKTIIAAEAGEMVMTRRATENNRPQLEAMNAGRSAGFGTLNVTVNAERGMSIADVLNIRRMFEDMLPDALDRLLNERRLSPAFAGRN